MKQKIIEVEMHDIYYINCNFISKFTALFINKHLIFYKT